MRIGKTIKGELYQFYLQFISKEKKASIRYFMSDDWTICELSEDYNYVLLSEGKFNFNGIDIKKLKLNKSQRLDAIDYNSF
jgi:uncharacterized pyridoxamine 5'-phosphate oxidase family protein